MSQRLLPVLVFLAGLIGGVPGGIRLPGQAMSILLRPLSQSSGRLDLRCMMLSVQVLVVTTLNSKVVLLDDDRANDAPNDRGVAGLARP
jgi:hypothetical protein